MNTSHDIPLETSHAVNTTRRLEDAAIRAAMRSSLHISTELSELEYQLTEIADMLNAARLPIRSINISIDIAQSMITNIFSRTDMGEGKGYTIPTVLVAYLSATNRILERIGHTSYSTDTSTDSLLS